jgi:hypothetical protein
MLGAACESDADRGKRFAKVEAGINAAFEAAVHHIGDERARQLFQKVLRRPNRRLLAAHDEAVEKGETVASVARRIRATGIKLGNTSAAIAAHIRRLVRARKQRERCSGNSSFLVLSPVISAMDERQYR